MEPVKTTTPASPQRNLRGTHQKTATRTTRFRSDTPLPASDRGVVLPGCPAALATNCSRLKWAQPAAARPHVPLPCTRAQLSQPALHRLWDGRSMFVVLRTIGKWITLDVPLQTSTRRDRLRVSTVGPCQSKSWMTTENMLKLSSGNRYRNIGCCDIPPAIASVINKPLDVATCIASSTSYDDCSRRARLRRGGGARKLLA